MLRLNEIKLPLNHSDDDLRLAILQKLGIGTEDLLDFSVYKRSHDARKKSAILLIYQLDVTLTRPRKHAYWRSCPRFPKSAQARTPATTLSRRQTRPFPPESNSARLLLVLVPVEF